MTRHFAQISVFLFGRYIKWRRGDHWSPAKNPDKLQRATNGRPYNNPYFTKIDLHGGTNNPVDKKLKMR